MRTRGGETVRLSAASIAVVNEENLADALAAVATEVDVSYGIPKEKYDSLVSRLNPDPRFAGAVTDADGKALLKGAASGQFVVMRDQRRILDSDEEYLWIVPTTDARDGQLLLSNHNLASDYLKLLLLQKHDLADKVAKRLEEESTQRLAGADFDGARTSARSLSLFADSARSTTLMRTIDNREPEELRAQAEKAVRDKNFAEARNLVRRADTLSPNPRTTEILASIDNKEAEELRDQAKATVQDKNFTKARNLLHQADRLSNSPKTTELLAYIDSEEAKELRAQAEQQGPLVLHDEEDVTILFWANLGLLPRFGRLRWFYSPVNGDLPGDLWGVDKNGELVIIECRRIPNRRDPFAGFEKRIGERTDGCVILKSWPEKYWAEVVNRRDCWTPPIGRKTNGFLPRSSKRRPLQRLKNLARVIDKDIRQYSFVREITELLDARQRAGNPSPHYGVLLIPRSCKDPKKDRRCAETLLQSGSEGLQKIGVAPERIHAYLCQAVRKRGTSIRVTVEEIHKHEEAAGE